MGRAPHGARGLKLRVSVHLVKLIRRAPHGARGLKRQRTYDEIRQSSRAPHGARGLKRQLADEDGRMTRSRPARGAWIETMMSLKQVQQVQVAPRTGRVD